MRFEFLILYLKIYQNILVNFQEQIWNSNISNFDLFQKVVIATVQISINQELQKSHFI